jgi:Fic family protein
MPRPSRDTIYARLETSVAGLEGFGGLPLPAEAEAIWKDIWLQEAHHSTAMEGNTLILREVQLLLDQHKAVGSKEMQAYLEVQGYGKAAQWVYAQAVRGGAPIQVSLTEIREIHRIVVEQAWLEFPPDQFDPKEGPGAFRRKNIEPFASGMRPPDWPDVHAATTDWCERVNDPATWAPARHPMETFAELHAGFERIHPFRDGNGRVGRLVLNLLLVRYGYPPAVIYKQDRDRYLKGLRRADDGDCGALAELLARSIKESIDRFILPGLAGPHKMIPLSALAESSGLTHNALNLAAQRGRLRAIKQGNQWHSTKKAVQEYRRSRYKRQIESPDTAEVPTGTDGTLSLLGPNQ